MPELPEVEFVRRHLSHWCVGRVVTAVEVLDTGRSYGDAACLVGHRCAAWTRRGKLLIGTFDGGTAILSHLAMTGKWVRDPADRRFQRIRLTFEASDAERPHQIALVAARRLAQTWFLEAPHVAEHPRVASLGPELFDPNGLPPSGDALRVAVGAGRGPVKTRLMDPKRVAGLGNICVVEGAFRAGLHPHRPTTSLRSDDWDALAAGIHGHIVDTLRFEGDRAEIAYVTQGGDNPFAVYGQSGKSCPRCQGPIARETLAGRPTFVCPQCQPKSP
ncbi:MAG: formamidopyrimidine-DNA glycosylase [Myxococcota bacterium]|jgi:formamidopyrimidine-DNA glycosylase